MKIFGMNCPHCGVRAQVSSSENLSPTLKKTYFQCTNIVCGHTWVSHIEAIYTISPPAEISRNPAVNLPLSPRAEQERLWRLINQPAEQSDLFDEITDEEE